MTALSCRRALGVLGIALGLLMALPADAVRKREEENPITNAPEKLPFKEQDVAPFAFPADKDLIEYTVNGRSTNRFFVDGSTLAIGEDQVIRFVLEVRSPSGVRNITFSGVRCDTQEWKDYAYGNPDGSWRIDSDAKWNVPERKRLNNYRQYLVDEFMCMNGVREGSNRGGAKTIVRLLKNPPEVDTRSPRTLR